MQNYLIDFVDTASNTVINNYFDFNQCTVLKSYSSFNKVYLVSSNSQPPLSEIVESIIVDDISTSVAPLEYVQISATPPSSNITFDINSTENWWKIYSFKDIDFDQTNITLNKFGKNVNVYLVDSGININHQEFTEKDITLIYSITSDFTDTTGHGTALASIIVGETCGITDSSLKVVKLWDSSLQTLQSQIISALDAILIDSQNSTNKFSVVNMSWTIPKNTYIENKLRILAQQGIALVAAAGNSGVPIENTTPASMNEVLTIGAYDQDFKPCDFSNYSNPLITSLTTSFTNTGQLDSWAPGIDIYAANVGGGYGYTAGTSAATAIYSASLAYIQSQLLTDSNNILSIYYKPDMTMDWNIVSINDRQQLLDLSDPKYSSSINRICTFRSLFDKPNYNNIVSDVNVKAKINEVHSMPLFIVNMSKGYELLGTLPPDVVIERNYVIFRPTSDTVDPTGVEITETPYRYTTSNDEVVNNTIRIIKIGSEFDVNTLPTNDPLIGITQTALCGYYPNDYYPNCGGGYCPGGEEACTFFTKACQCG